MKESEISCIILPFLLTRIIKGESRNQPLHFRRANHLADSLPPSSIHIWSTGLLVPYWTDVASHLVFDPALAFTCTWEWSQVRQQTYCTGG